ncbi:MAG: hypothetical protein ACOX2O_00520 [Bdellovibrionota bacterium]|jgi:hypothetical protein
MQTDPFFSYMASAAQEVGGEKVFFVLAAVFSLLFLKKILLFSNKATWGVMLLPTAIYLIQHPLCAQLSSQYPITTLIPAVWGCELLLFVALKMGLGLFSVFTPVNSKFSVCLVVFCVAFLASVYLKPDWIATYLPMLNKETACLVACGMLLTLALWKVLKAVLPVFIWSGIAVTMLFLVFESNYVNNLTDNSEILDYKQKALNAFHDGKAVLNIAMRNYLEL